MKLFDSKNRYQDIWRYLSNELSEDDEASLLDWVSANERNNAFFNSVVIDFNEAHGVNELCISYSEPKIKGNTKPLWKYGIAAAISLLLSASILLLLVKGNNSSFSSIYLSDGTKITKDENTIIHYDSQSYHLTGIIQIEGEAWVSSPEDKSTILTIETSAGYFMLNNAEAYFENNASGNTTIQLIKGEARLISLNEGAYEIEVSAGQKLSFIKDYNAFTFSKDSDIKSPI